MATSERRTMGISPSAGGRTQDLFHLFPYHLVAEFAADTARVLEVGFGEGYGAELLADHVAEYVGLEVSSSALEHARSQHAKENIRFERYDGVTIPFENGSFDVVVSFHVIEHLEDPTAFVAELRRVCRAGGRTALVTPNAAFRLLPGQRPWSRFHVREFTRDELERLVAPYFSSLSVFGIAGSDEMNEVERARVTKARRLARLDPLGVRFLLPEAVLLPARRALMSLGHRSHVAVSGMSLEAVHIVSDDVDLAPHLIALADA